MNLFKKTALLGIKRGEWREVCRGILETMGYTVDVFADEMSVVGELSRRGSVIVLFDVPEAELDGESNAVQRALNTMPMSQRRQLLTCLIGETFDTLNPLQAFQKSVHAVIHPKDLAHLKGIIENLLSDKGALAFYRLFEGTAGSGAR